MFSWNASRHFWIIKNIDEFNQNLRFLLYFTIQGFLCSMVNVNKEILYILHIHMYVYVQCIYYKRSMRPYVSCATILQSTERTQIYFQLHIFYRLTIKHPPISTSFQRIHTVTDAISVRSTCYIHIQETRLCINVLRGLESRFLSNWMTLKRRLGCLDELLRSSSRSWSRCEKIAISIRRATGTVWCYNARTLATQYMRTYRGATIKILVRRWQWKEISWRYKFKKKTEFLFCIYIFFSWGRAPAVSSKFASRII